MDRASTLGILQEEIGPHSDEGNNIKKDEIIVCVIRIRVCILGLCKTCEEVKEMSPEDFLRRELKADYEKESILNETKVWRRCSGVDLISSDRFYGWTDWTPMGGGHNRTGKGDEPPR